MARYEAMLPTELIKQFEKIHDNTFEMMGGMTKAGAQVVYKNVQANMSKSFKSTKSLNRGLTITKVYRTPSDDGVNNKVGFYGYDTTKKTKQYPGGVPIPLIALAREYGQVQEKVKNHFLGNHLKRLK